jgi:hypothetical protein
MELFTKHALNNLPTPTGWSSSSLRRWWKTQNLFRMKLKF